MPIEVKNLCYSYKVDTPFEKKVLHNISLTINDGDFIGLVGPTQAGKTTLAQHFNALLLPQKGSVLVDGHDTSSKDSDLGQLRQKVGYVFQNPDYQLFAPTVGEDVAFGPKNQGLAADEINARIELALSQVGLDPAIYLKRDIYALSGGQKKRVALAGVLACQPQILILDDITAGLDPRGREDILKIVAHLNREEKVTIVFISNNMEVLARLAHRLVVMDKGQVLMEGRPEDIFSQTDKLEAIGLEIPPFMAVANKLRCLGFSLPPALLSLEETAESIAGFLQKRQVGH